MAEVDTNIHLFDASVLARISADSSRIKSYAATVGVPVEGITAAVAR